MQLLKQLGFKNIQPVDPEFDERKIEKKKDISIQKLVVALSYYKGSVSIQKA